MPRQRGSGIKSIANKIGGVVIPIAKGAANIAAPILVPAAKNALTTGAKKAVGFMTGNGVLLSGQGVKLAGQGRKRTTAKKKKMRY